MVRKSDFFRMNDAEIIDNETGKKCNLVKRMGVYFMRLYFPKSPGDSQSSEGFVRPDL